MGKYLVNRWADFYPWEMKRDVNHGFMAMHLDFLNIKYLSDIDTLRDRQRYIELTRKDAETLSHSAASSMRLHLASLLHRAKKHCDTVIPTVVSIFGIFGIIVNLFSETSVIYQG